MLSMREWNQIAERAAADSFGRKHARKYAFLRFAPVYAGLAALGALGAGIWWLQDKAHEAWSHRSAVSVPAAHTGVPVWVWLALGVLALLTFIAFRPGRGTDSAAALLGKIFGLGLLWLISIGLLVGFAF